MMTTAIQSNNNDVGSSSSQSARTASKRKMTNKLTVKRMKKIAPPRISAQPLPPDMSTSSSSHGVKRRQRPKMSRTHSPVYVRVPAVRFDIFRYHSTIFHEYH